MAPSASRPRYLSGEQFVEGRNRFGLAPRLDEVLDGYEAALLDSFTVVRSVSG